MSRSRGQTAAEGSWFLRLALRSSTSFSLVLTCNSWAVQKRHVFSTHAWESMFCIVLYDFVIGLDCPLSSFRSTPRIGEKHRVAWLDKFRTFRFLEEATVIRRCAQLHASVLSTPSAPTASSASFATLDIPKPKGSSSKRNGSFSILWRRPRCCPWCFHYSETSARSSQRHSKKSWDSCLRPSRSESCIWGSP